MRTPIRLNKTIGEAYDMDLADALTAKQALASLGLLEPPEDGVDEYPDRPMIEAVKSFQRAEGLAEDGVMKPDGPTLARLNSALENASVPALPSNRQDTSATSLLGPAPEPTSPLDRHLASLSARPGAEASVRPRRPAPEGVQVAMAPAVAMIPSLIGLAARTLLGQTARTATGAATAGTAGALLGRMSKEDENQAITERTDITPAFPPPPGYEPPPEDDRKPNITEFPAEPVRIPDIAGPAPKLEKPSIFITPAPKPGEFGPQILENKGGPMAKEQLDKLRDQFLQANPDCTHIAGGRRQEDGEEVTEFYTAGPGRAFPRPGKKYGDGRQGSAPPLRGLLGCWLSQERAGP